MTNDDNVCGNHRLIIRLKIIFRFIENNGYISRNYWRKCVRKVEQTSAQK